jgi:DNA-directed RNA polymerase subunit M/transcription elongation factor TFIIS
MTSKKRKTKNTSESVHDSNISSTISSNTSIDHKRQMIRETLMNVKSGGTEKKRFSLKETAAVEKAIYHLCVELSKKYDDNVEDLYDKYSYEKLGDIIKGHISYNEVLQDIKNGNIDWDSCSFKEYKFKEEQLTNEKIEGPKLKKGEFQCQNKDCKSFECYHYQAQQRSADEGATTHVVCTKCGHRYHFV